MPKPSLEKKNSGTIEHIPRVWGIRAFVTFQKCISPKVNVIARLEFEPAYYDNLVLHVSHYASRIPSQFIN